jgi:hypothetical protein
VVFPVDAKKLLKAFHNSKKESKILKKAIKKAHTRTEEQSLENYTQIVNDHRQFINNPPLMVRVTDVPKSNALSEKVQVLRSDLEKPGLSMSAVLK